MIRRLRSLLFRARAEREMDAELADHLACEIEEGLARGLSPTEAESRARRLLGRRSVLAEEIRDARGLAWWEELRQDFRFGLRLLARQPAYTLTALATLMLAIGSTTAVFSLVDATLLRPLPFPAPGQLFDVAGPGIRGAFEVLRRESRLAHYAAHLGIRAFTGQGQPWPERWKGSEVSPGFFDVLGVPPALGRTFRPEEKDAVVLSHAFWRERFQSRPDAIGQRLVLDERPREVIGVMPSGFAFPGTEAGFWVPMRLDPRVIGEYWGSGGVATFARLRGGTTAGQAEAELRAWMPRIRSQFPWRMPDAWGTGARLAPLAEALSATSRPRHWLLFGVVALLLVAAVVNLANLAVSQAAARRAEFELRTALGASRFRLARMLLAESVLLAAAGGLLGVLMAPLQLDVLRSLLPADTPRLAEAAVDGRVLAFAAALTLAAGVAAGAWPAFGRPSRRTGWLVTAEAAVACLLLCAAGLMLRSWVALARTDPGFRAESLVTAELSPSQSRVPLDALVRLEREIHAALRAWPGVTQAGALNVLPLSQELSAFTIAIEDHPRPPSAPQFGVWLTAMTPELAPALGVRLLRGRAFTAADHAQAPPVALISRAMAERFWPGQDPVGRRWRPVWLREWRTIVGVVEDVRHYTLQGLPEWVDGSVYVPLAQAFGPVPALSLVARVEGDTRAFERALPGLVGRLCRECAVSRIARMENVVAESTRAPRATATLTTAFALLALAMAAAGLFGVVSQAVLRRTREFGIRLALGARRSSIAWLVLRGSLRETLLGGLAGLAAAGLLAQWLRTMLYGVEPWDLPSFALAPLILLGVAALACAVPVWRASTTDAVRSLREN